MVEGIILDAKVAKQAKVPVSQRRMAACRASRGSAGTAALRLAAIVAVCLILPRAGMRLGLNREQEEE